MPLNSPKGTGTSGGRKLVAVVHADIVGYSRLIGADDAGTLERVRVLRRNLIDPAVSEHGGRIANIAGDALLIVFDSVEGAVRCAIKVQQQVPVHDRDLPPDCRIRFRIGINVGDVIVDGTDVHGDGVNVAARLQAKCSPGAVCVSRAVHEHIRGRLDLMFEAVGLLNLKNIAQPVEAFMLHPDAATAERSGERTLVHSVGEARQLPDKPSLVVLPFQNMSGDPGHDYFADGMVEEITTALSRVGSLFIIARNSAFTYKGRAVDVRQVGRELGVRYVLEGSVRKSGSRVRITAQLIEAEKGGHIWADRFDGPVDDIFDLQDRVTEHVVGALEPNMVKAEIVRAMAKPTDRLDAYDLYLQALQQTYLLTEPANRTAQRLLQKAIEMDERFALAKALAARAVTQSVMYQWTPEDSEAAAHAVTLARSALTDSPDDSTILSWAGHVLSYLGKDLDAARAVLDRALDLNNNSATVLSISGWVHNWRGEFEIARDEFLRAVRLSPLDPSLINLRGGLAVALTFGEPPELGRALDLIDQSLAVSPNDFNSLQQRTVALVMLGRMDEAKETARRMLSVSPGTSISRFRSRWRHRKGIADRTLAAFRTAGIPE
jgi:adenylate cyclase